MHFHVVKSSAGSGKTYALVKQYLTHLLGSLAPDYFRHILAITFTNKATDEMKERIIAALKGISTGAEKQMDLASDLSKETGLDHEIIRQRASSILQNLIHNYGDFNISTIDHFVNRIVKSFSFEMGIPSNIEIELKEDRLIRKIVDGLFEKMSDDEKLSNVLLAYSEYKFTEEQNYDVEVNLFDLTRELMRSDGRGYLKKFEKFELGDFINVQKELSTRVKSMTVEIQTLASELKSLIEQTGLEASDMYRGSSGVHKYIFNLADKGDPMILPNSYVRTTLEESKWLSPKASDTAKSSFISIETNLEQGLNELIHLIETHIPHYTFCRMLSGQIHSLAIVNEVKKEIDLIKDEYNVARLEDFNKIIAEIVKDNPIPYIYERIGEKFHHYLIDEFQDTSEIQWFNLLPLLENGLSEGFGSLIVGDAKQAIYRWRGGELDQLNRLPELNFNSLDISENSDLGRNMKAAFNEKFLDSNYRSAENVVRFVNHFFEILNTSFPDELNTVYSGHTQKSMSAISGGVVEIKFLPDESLLENAAGYAVNKIKELMQSGVHSGDIALLCRTRFQCTMMASLLLDNQIPFISDESLKLYHSGSVRFVLNWLLYLYTGRNPQHAYKILEYLAENKGLGYIDEDKLPEIWAGDPSLENVFAKADINLDVHFLSKENLLELVYTLIETFIGSERKDRYMLALENCVSEFMGNYGNDPIEFLKWWEDNKEDLAITYPSLKSAVRIMTIHKAKGLEFNTVIVPFSYGRIKPGKSHIWVESKEKDSEVIPIAWLKCSEDLLKTNYADLYNEEMRMSFTDTVNLMYVGATRAKHGLYITSKIPSKSSGKITEEALWYKSMSLELNESVDADFFRFGNEANEKVNTSPEKSPVLSYPLSPMSSWRDRIMLKYKTDVFDLQSSGQDAISEGLLIHEIMSRVVDLGELSSVLSYYVLLGDISQEKADSLKKKITGLIVPSEVNRYFVNVKGRVFNEREMMDVTGKLLRPDRCVVEGDHMIVIDYKTGSPHDSHKEQIRQYVKLARELGYADVDAFLIYFSEGLIEKLQN